MVDVAGDDVDWVRLVEQAGSIRSLPRVRHRSRDASWHATQRLLPPFSFGASSEGFYMLFGWCKAWSYTHRQPRNTARKGVHENNQRNGPSFAS